MNNKKKILISFLSLALGFLLLGGILVYLYRKQVDVPDYSGFNYYLLPLLAISTWLHNFIMAEKWHMIVKVDGKNRIEKRHLFKYVIYSSLLGQVIPFFISSLGIRGIVSKKMGISSVGSGVLSALYDHFFDILVLALVLLPTLLILFELVRTEYVVGIVVLLLFSSMLYIASFGIKTINYFTSIIQDIKPRKDIITMPARVTNTLLVKLYVFSILRFINLVLLGYFIALIINIDIGPLTIFLATPFSQLATILTVTPGGLGTMEWTWIGILPIFSVTYQEASIFALAHRVFSVSALAFVYLVVLISKPLLKPRS